MQFDKKAFKNDDVRLDGNTFIECTFKNCVMVYGGGPPPVMNLCHFHDVNWSFVEQAGNTLELMRSIYHGAGDGGRHMIEQTFDEIRKLPK